MSLVKLVGITKPVIDDVDTAEDLVAYAARVSNPANQNNNLTSGKLLKYLINNEHWSPLEMVHVVMEINTTRDIARQILRHRSFSFQEFCIAGDSTISVMSKSGKKYRLPIAKLYEMQQAGSLVRDLRVRSYNTETKLLEYFPIKEVFSTGKREVLTLTLDNGKSIKATKEHKFLTRDGFTVLEDICVGDFLAHNGEYAYQNKDWLIDAKQCAIDTGTGLQGIADLAGCSYDTIRKWLRVHGLQFTKQEVASYTSIWNKGLPKEQQPMYGKAHSNETRERMRESAKSGEASNLYSSGEYTKDKLSFRRRVAQIARGSLNTLKHRQDNKCALCGRSIAEVDDTNLGIEVDHILPVSTHPEIALEECNMQAVCLFPCHGEKSRQESSQMAQTIIYSKVISISQEGITDTYDLEVDHSSHNYVANGIITHNSQRYADARNMSFRKREARLQDQKNRQNSIETSDDELSSVWDAYQTRVQHEAVKAYDWAIRNGLAKEQARVVLPEGMTNSRLYMAGTLRSWLHYCLLRRDNGTQKEHREIAVEALKVLSAEFPSITEIVNEKESIP